MIYVIWSITILLGGGFVICAIGNAVIVAMAWTGRSNTSMVPLVGGIFGTLAVLALPAAENLKFYWWAPLFLDIGCAPAAISAIAYCLWRRLREFGGETRSGARTGR